MAGELAVIPRDREIKDLAHAPYVRDELVRQARPIVAEAQRRAPSSDTGSHGRRAGYLRSRIRLRPGQDVHGVLVDVVSDAQAPDGYPYAKELEKRRPYLKPSIPRNGQWRITP